MALKHKMHTTPFIKLFYLILQICVYPLSNDTCVCVGGREREMFITFTQKVWHRKTKKGQNRAEAKSVHDYSFLWSQKDCSSRICSSRRNSKPGLLNFCFKEVEGCNSIKKATISSEWWMVALTRQCTCPHVTCCSAFSCWTQHSTNSASSIFARLFSLCDFFLSLTIKINWKGYHFKT